MNCFFIILGQRHGVIILVKPINQELFEEWREIYLLHNIFVVCFEGVCISISLVCSLTRPFKTCRDRRAAAYLRKQEQRMPSKHQTLSRKRPKKHVKLALVNKTFWCWQPDIKIFLRIYNYGFKKMKEISMDSYCTKDLWHFDM